VVWLSARTGAPARVPRCLRPESSPETQVLPGAGRRAPRALSPYPGRRHCRRWSGGAKQVPACDAALARARLVATARTRAARADAVRPVRLSSQYVERIKGVWPGDPGPAGRRAPGAVALSGEAPLSARELRAEASAHVRRRPSRPRIRPRACRAGGCQCLRASRLEYAKKQRRQNLIAESS
jgi:hypothetical protein